LVFDEIDTGIGGRVADAVGVRLHRLAQSNQVVCVTHQAQIARYADTHLQVSKEIKGQRTVTTVTRLEAGARVEELARMMAGAGVTEVTRQHAQEMLASL
jgi:DNA repair protein RecN (Recombination protein N)